MTHPLAALIAGVTRYNRIGQQMEPSHDGRWLHRLEVLAALEAATPPDLVEAGKVLEGTTPGPWMYRPNKYDDWGVVKADDFRLCQVRDPNCYMTEDLDAARAAKVDPWETNARFIAWCREGVPSLIALATAQAAQIAGLTKERDELREELLDLNKQSISKQANLQRELTAEKAEVERLRGALKDMVAVAEQDGWDKAMTGRQLVIAAARAALEDKA